MITLKLTRGNDPEGIYIRLPSAQKKIKEAVARLDAISEDVATTRILNIASNVRNLGNYIQNADLSQPDGLQKIEALAEKLQTLDMESCLKFEGMLDANMIQGVDDVMKLAECLNEYVLLPEVGTESALGRYLVNQGVLSVQITFSLTWTTRQSVRNFTATTAELFAEVATRCKRRNCLEASAAAMRR